MNILQIITESTVYAEGTSADVDLAGLDIHADQWAQILPDHVIPRRIYFNDAYEAEVNVLGMAAGGDWVEARLIWPENYVNGSDSWQDVYEVDTLTSAQRGYADRAMIAAWRAGIWPLVQQQFAQAQLMNVHQDWRHDMVQATIRYIRPDQD